MNRRHFLNLFITAGLLLATVRAPLISMASESSADCTLTRAAEEHTLDITITGEGSVAKAPDQEVYQYGDDVTLTPLPELGWSFEAWAGENAGDPVDNGDGTWSLLVDEDKALEAIFAEDAYSVAVTPDPPEGGYVDYVAGPYLYSEAAILTPTANLGWCFAGWGGPNGQEPVDNLDGTWSLTMDSDKQLTANFQKTYALLLSSIPPEGGAIITEPDVGDYPGGYPEGTSVSLSADPNPGYSFDGWSGDDADKCDTGSFVMNDHVICIAYFTYVAPPAASNSHWMADLSEEIGDRTLLDVVLPGTHDSGTYGITMLSEWASLADQTSWEKSLQWMDLPIAYGDRFIVSLWSKAQSVSILRQLNDGVRYLDLRFIKDWGSFRIHHTLLSAYSEVIFADVQEFLEQPGHEKEIIILDLNNWKNMDDTEHQWFVAMLYERFGDRMIPRDDRDASLSEIWADGKQLVIRYEGLTPSMVPDGVDENLFWTDICSPWANTPSEAVLQARLSSWLECPSCIDDCDNGELFVLQGIRTPDVCTVFCGLAQLTNDHLNSNWGWCFLIPGWCILLATFVGIVEASCGCSIPGAPVHLVDLGRHTTPQVCSWVNQWWRDCQYGARDNLNIIIGDYYQAGLVPTVIGINSGALNTAPEVEAGPDLAVVKNEEMKLEVGFSDSDTCDEHSASVEWGDGTVTDGIVSESGGSGTISGSHAYGDNGTYTITVCVRDDFDETCDTVASIEVAPRVSYLPLVIKNYRRPAPQCRPYLWRAQITGSAPHGIALNADLGQVYVANHDDDLLSVLDADSLSPVATAGAGDGPNGVAYHPGRGLIYIASSRDNTVTVLRASDHQHVSTIPVGGRPNGIAVNAELDLVYVANFGEGTVSLIDAANNSVDSTVPVGAEPSMISVNPATNKAYVSLHGEGKVAVVDGAGQVKSVDIYDSSGSYGVAVDSVRNLVYVATIDTARIVAIDGQTDTYLGWAQIKRLPGGQPVPLRMIAVNPDIGTSGHIFVTTAGNDGGWDKFLLLAKGWPEYFARPYALDLEEPREGIAFDPVRQRVYATSRAGNQVSVYQDGEPVCATNFRAPAGLYLEVCVAAPDGRCKETTLR